MLAAVVRGLAPLVALFYVATIRELGVLVPLAIICQDS